MTAIPLAYPERLNSFHGPSGGGKTWLAVLAVVETVRRGQRAAVIDYEDHPNGWALRLVQIGLDPAEAALVDYVRPAGDLMRAIGTLERRGARLGHEWALVVVDSVGEAISAVGGNPNDDRDVAPFMTTARFAARLPGHPAVILLDHVTKAAEAGSGEEGPAMHAAGSFRKRAAIDGASYAVEVKVAPAKGKAGRLAIFTAKDRHGHRPQRTLAAYAELGPCDGPIDGCLRIRLVAPAKATESGEKFRPTVLMERVSAWLELNPGASRRAVCAALKGDDKHKLTALDRLVEEGYVTTAPGPRSAILHTSARPFRQVDDDRSTTDSTAVGPRCDRGGTAVDSDGSTAVHRGGTTPEGGATGTAVETVDHRTPDEEEGPTAVAPPEPPLEMF